MEGMRIPLQIFGTKSIHSIDYDDITHIAQLTTATGVKTVTIKKKDFYIENTIQMVRTPRILYHAKISKTSDWKIREIYSSFT